ncbi:MAG: murein transglycosylase [Rhodospirillaceae bacterium]|nr:murein transglycosylase [Rhodospirillaceae bacterium]
MNGRIAVIWAGGLLIALGLLMWWATRPPPSDLEQLSFRAVAYDDLDGWATDDHGAAVVAFRHSCDRFATWPDDRNLSGNGDVAGRARDWAEVCDLARGLPPGPAAARKFFESHFKVVAVRYAGAASGLFTGYYEPLLHGSRQRWGPYIHPLYGMPKDLIRVNLGEFNDSLKGQHIVGRVHGARLRPYFERRQIEAGALAGQGLEVVYVDDPVDAFFLQIQGSGRVALTDGGVMRLGYGGRNGRRYYAIGRELIKRGILTAENVSMQSIRAWLTANPDAGRAVMDLNPSFVFFQELTGPGPVGALGVALTPGRSIAVDRRLIPLGIPIWLQASRPAATVGGADRPLHRLVIAQDTGGAIKGGVRGDMFWGHGADAAAIAGRMKHAGEWFLLLPNALGGSHLR